jgi:hypothetical protein
MLHYIKESDFVKIHIISTYESKEVFQEKVNQWLVENSDLKITDIKYSTTEIQNNIYHSAMVIYKESK